MQFANALFFVMVVIKSFLHTSLLYDFTDYLQTFMQCAEQANLHLPVKTILDVSVVKEFKLPPGTSCLKNVFPFISANQYKMLLICLGKKNNHLFTISCKIEK